MLRKRCSTNLLQLAAEGRKGREELVLNVDDRANEGIEGLDLRRLGRLRGTAERMRQETACKRTCSIGGIVPGCMSTCRNEGGRGTADDRAHLAVDNLAGGQDGQGCDETHPAGGS